MSEPTPVGTITVLDLPDPAAELQRDLTRSVNDANVVEREAVKWATATATAWLKVAAIQLRAVLPDAAAMHVDTWTWAEDRGENRPTVLRVVDANGRALYVMEGEVSASTPEGVDEADVDEVVLEVCTTLDHALRYMDPWRLEAWSPLGRMTSRQYVVQLPDTPRLDLESDASRQHHTDTGRYLLAGEAVQAR